jgi:tetratricopeptide (TPR) repeat protein
VLRSVLGIIRTDEPDVSALRSGIVSLFPRDELVLRSYASIALGFASRVGGDLPLALRHFQEALEGSERANSSLVNLNARLNIGIVKYLMGRNSAAEESFRKSLDVARERSWLRSIGAAFLRYGLALALHERNRLGEALEELSQAIEILEQGDAFGFLGMALVERARTQFLLGKHDLAVADLAQARQVARQHDVERVSFRADLLEARMGCWPGSGSGKRQGWPGGRCEARYRREEGATRSNSWCCRQWHGPVCPGRKRPWPG